jgi:hypothetical protein
MSCLDWWVAEMFLVGGEKERLYLRKRKGFVREAIKVRGQPTFSASVKSLIPAGLLLLAERSRPGAMLLLR